MYKYLFLKFIFEILKSFLGEVSLKLFFILEKNIFWEEILLLFLY